MTAKQILFLFKNISVAVLYRYFRLLNREVAAASEVDEIFCDVH